MPRQKYLDGIRGVAALVVVLCHFCQIFLPATFSRGVPDHFGERALATTPLNILVNGNFAVAIFFVLSGYVLSAPYFTGQRRRWYLEAAIKRYPRLVAPALASTVLAWVMFRTLGYHFGAIVSISGADMPNVFAKITRFDEALWQGAIGAFFFESYSYNQVLWTIRTELFGSLLIFATVPLVGRWKWRWLIYLATILWLRDNYLLGFVLGALCADLSSIGQWSTESAASSFVWPVLLIFGIYLGAYPYFFNGSASIWSPIAAIPYTDIFIASHLIGGFLCILSSTRLPAVRRLFEVRHAQFLGRISYGMYLIHFIYWGSVGCWLALKLIPVFGYGQALSATFLISLPIILAVSYAFTRLIDEPAMRSTSRWARALIKKANLHFKTQNMRRGEQ